MMKNLSLSTVRKLSNAASHHEFVPISFSVNSRMVFVLASVGGGEELPSLVSAFAFVSLGQTPG